MKYYQKVAKCNDQKNVHFLCFKGVKVKFIFYTFCYFVLTAVTLFIGSLLGRNEFHFYTSCLAGCLIALLAVRDWSKGCRWYISLYYFVWAILVICFYTQLQDFISKLGTDSLAEAKEFELKDAIFYLDTFGRIFMENIDILFVFAAVLGCVGVYVAVSVYLNKIPKNFFLGVSHLRAFLRVLLLVAISASLAKFIQLNIAAAGEYDSTVANFSNENSLAYKKAKRDINLVVYIGESTSRMTLGNYGFFASETPFFDQQKTKTDQYIQFDQFYSGHTHTSPTLLEAFSFSVGGDKLDYPIYERQRLSLVKFLEEAGVYVSLKSNQGYAGSYNYVSTIIFKDIKDRFYNKKQTIGNMVIEDAYIYDHLMFEGEVANFLKRTTSNKSLLLLHSFAGHGTYKSFIPEEFRKKKIHADKFTDKMLFGLLSAHDFRAQWEDYLRAMSYIDYSVSTVAAQVDDQDEPIILVYFADHGDSAFTGRGHDSSRLMYEMSTIPFSLYFNKAARQAYPDLFLKYKSLAALHHVNSLSDLPYILSDLLGVTVEGTDQRLEDDEIPPIVVRRLANERTLIDFNKLDPEHPLPSGYKEAVLTRLYGTKDRHFCYHRSNNIARFVRGLTASGCAEIDVVVDGNLVEVYHPPAENIHLELGDLLGVSPLAKSSIWVDAKNITTETRCQTLAARLKAKTDRLATVLVEFPPEASEVFEETSLCMDQLEMLGYFRSSYLPTGLGLTCLKNEEGAEKACSAFTAHLKTVLEKSVFSDISFDLRLLPLVQAVPEASQKMWNSWNLDERDVEKLDLSKFRMIIPRNQDPNYH